MNKTSQPLVKLIIALIIYYFCFFLMNRYGNADEEGEMTYTCRNCGETRTEAIPKLDVIPIDSAKVSGITDKPYTGEAITQEAMTVTLNGKTLEEGTDYTVSYSENIQIGVVTVTITGTGHYEGSIEETFRIQFKDVTDRESQFYYDHVYWLTDLGVIKGWSDGTFRPMNDINRASVITFLWRLEGRPEPSKMATFKDMPADTAANQDFRKAISWGLENGILTGWTDDNTFRPWQSCNRAAIVTFIWRYAGRPEVSAEAGFTDMTTNTEFNKAISWAAENGITTGFDDNTFRPWDTCKRLAVASFLYRFENQ